ncbi:14598_t:CDS:1, partial [Funneliformis geosporum]
MRSDVTKLSSADYENIMQYRDMKFKPLKEIKKEISYINFSFISDLERAGN